MRNLLGASGLSPEHPKILDKNTPVQPYNASLFSMRTSTFFSISVCPETRASICFAQLALGIVRVFGTGLLIVMEGPTAPSTRRKLCRSRYAAKAWSLHWGERLDGCRRHAYNHPNRGQCKS